MRTIEMSARTVEDAVAAACEALGVDRDDLNVSYEVLEFPARKLFKVIPAKVRVKVEEPEDTAPETAAPAPVEAAEAPVEETPARPKKPHRRPLSPSRRRTRRRKRRWTSVPTRGCRRRWST